MTTLMMTLFGFALLALAGCLFRSLLHENLGMNTKHTKKESESAIHFIRSI